MQTATFSNLNSFKRREGFGFCSGKKNNPIREETVETPRSELRGGSRKGSEGIGAYSEDERVGNINSYQLISRKQDLEKS